MVQAAESAARSRVEKAVEITGWSPTRLAKESGVAVSTLTRFLYRDPGYTLSLPTLAKIDRAVERYIHTLPDAKDTIRLTLEYQSAGHIAPVMADTITIDVRGAVQAGNWAAAAEWDETDWEKASFPRPGNYSSYFGLRVKGPSMNLVYPEGTILVCVPFQEYGRGLTEHEHVIVERWDAGQVEATVKELRKSPEGGVWLWPRSDHPEHQTPIALPINNEDHRQDAGSDEIRVVAIVVADYRIRPHLIDDRAQTPSATLGPPTTSKGDS